MTCWFRFASLRSPDERRGQQTDGEGRSSVPLRFFRIRVSQDARSGTRARPAGSAAQNASSWHPGSDAARHRPARSMAASRRAQPRCLRLERVVECRRLTKAGTRRSAASSGEDVVPGEIGRRCRRRRGSAARALGVASEDRGGQRRDRRYFRRPDALPPATAGAPRWPPPARPPPGSTARRGAGHRSRPSTTPADADGDRCAGPAAASARQHLVHDHAGRVVAVRPLVPVSCRRRPTQTTATFR